MKVFKSASAFLVVPLLVLLHGCACSGYVATLPTTFSVVSRCHSSKLRMAVELEPEPEGGEELQPIDSIVGCRLKNMGESEDVKNDDGTVYNFWLSAEADGGLIKEFRAQILKDASKEANFPGFRKGQVPPYAQPQITFFAVQEGLIKTVEAAVGAFGLKSLPGQDGEINVNEDVKEICEGYKIGDTIPYTVTFRAIFDPEKARPSADNLSESEASDDERLQRLSE